MAPGRGARAGRVKRGSVVAQGLAGKGYKVSRHSNMKTLITQWMSNMGIC